MRAPVKLVCLRFAGGLMAFLSTAACGDTPSAPILLPSPPPAPLPPQTYTVSGTLAQSGGGPPLAGATVRTNISYGSPIVATTDANGMFLMSGVLRGRNFFTFSKPGFEDVHRGYDITSDRTIGAHLHPRLEMSANAELSATLYPDDPRYEYWLGDVECEPCKQIRVTLSDAARVKVRLIPQSSELCFWLESPPEGGSWLGRACGRFEASGVYSAAARGLSVMVYSEAGAVTEAQSFQLITSTP